MVCEFSTPTWAPFRTVYLEYLMKALPPVARAVSSSPDAYVYLAVGGAITTAPDMQRYLVRERGWIGDGEFTASVALAQAAPGPNVLFVAVLGWNVAGAAGAAVTLAGIMLPSTTLALWATRWGRAR